MAIFRKNEEEYIPQFEIDDTELETPAYCKICGKIDDTIDADGVCYVCRKRMERQNQIKTPDTKYAELIDNHNSKIYDKKTIDNTNVERITSTFLKLKIIWFLSPTVITIILLLTAFLNNDVLYGWAVISGGWALYGFLKIIPIFKNIKMLKRMGMYELSKKPALQCNRVVLDEKKFIITEKFIYSNGPWAVLPIEHIDTITLVRGIRTHVNHLYLVAQMTSGERFTVYVTMITCKEELVRYTNEIKSINPLIEFEYVL